LGHRREHEGVGNDSDLYTQADVYALKMNRASASAGESGEGTGCTRGGWRMQALVKYELVGSVATVTMDDGKVNVG
jgi:hypothetical protein